MAMDCVNLVYIRVMASLEASWSGYQLSGGGKAVYITSRKRLGVEKK
jgi:hypothetical protein